MRSYPFLFHKSSFSLKYRLSLIVVAVGAVFFFSPTNLGLAADRQMLRGHVPKIVSQLKSLGGFPGTNRLNLAIGLPLRNEAELDRLLQQIYDPASPAYRHYLTPEEFTARFGPSAQDYQAVMDFARANGLQVTTTHPNRVVLDVSGSVADLERVFHVTLRTYRHPKENRRFYAPDTEPSIDLAVPVLSISGLDDFSLPHPANLRVKPVDPLAGVLPLSGSGSGGSYRGADFRAAYVPGTLLTGAGQTVGLLQFDGYHSNDIVSYESLAGLSSVSLTNVPIDGGVSIPGPGNGEVCLDIEMVISMAPGIKKIIVYEAPNPSPWIDLLSRMANDNLASQLSCSWGGGSPDAASEVIFKQMAAQGQSFFNASGDSDALVGSVPFPADSTNITQVGATTLSTTGPGGSWVSETVWNWGGGTGSSGGISTFYPIPYWQQGINMSPSQGSTVMRNIPDVALTGDNVFVTYSNGLTGVFGGTSCAAPLWAGFMALANQQAAAAGQPRVGFINPAVYEIGRESSYASSFHDITTGNNTWSGSATNFFAVPGYDLCTGWGTPNGTNLIKLLVNPDPLIIAPVSGFNTGGQHGGPFNFTTQIFSLTNSGAGSLNWSVAGLPAWLNASSAGGTLVSGGTNGVAISLNSTASNLFGGVYTAAVCFTNQTSQIGHYRQFTLLINDPLGILPRNGPTLSGPVGGPFNVSSQNFLLTNLNAGSLDWAVSGIPSWLDVSPVGGTLPAFGGAVVTVGLNSTGSSLLAVAGLYVTNLTFTDLTSGVAQNIQFTLALGQSLGLNNGFETGDFTGWTVSGNSGEAAVVNSPAQFVHAGSYGAFLGNVASLGYLAQTLSTVPGQTYLLSFWLNNPNNTTLGSVVTPNQFVVNWNTNASSTNTIFNQVNMAAINSWTNMLFVVAATGTNTVLQFGDRNDPVAFGLDDISVQPVPRPSFRSAVQTNNAISFTWNTVAGVAYQVQYSTNLAGTNWLILRTNIANGFTLTATNVIGTNGQRFYRIRRLP